VAGLVTRAMLKRHALEMREYAFNTVMSLLVAYMFFLMIFVGAWASLGEQASFGQTLAQVVVGLMVWMMALQAFSEVASRISTEAMQGTLEQLAMAPLGLRNVLLCRAVAMSVIQLGYVLVFLVLMMVTTRQWLHLDLLSLVPLLLVTVGSVQGLGFAMGGATLLFKRTAATFGLWQFVFIALLAVPVEKSSLVMLLPLAWGAHLIRGVMIEGISLLEIPVADLLLLVLNSSAYFALGLLVFGRFERMARERGVLGHY
jgi:ABC-2 type transport system permease protein